jgi:integrase
MDTSLSPHAENQLAELRDTAEEYIRASVASNTSRAYAGDWKSFVTWCDRHGRQALPADPETVALFLADEARRLKVATLGRRLCVIGAAHRTAGHPSPTHAEAVRRCWSGIRRSLGTTQQGKSPAVTADIRRMIAELPAGILGVRDRALLLIGFAAALRRSELVALDVEDIEFVAQGMVITLRRSKTDQEAAGRKIGIPHGACPETCPVRALRAWLGTTGITSGPVFKSIDRHSNISTARLTPASVALVVKRAAEAAGLDPTRFSGHSLRAGFATEAARAGVEERVIAQQTGHRSMTVLRRYIHAGSLWHENAASAVGL